MADISYNQLCELRAKIAQQLVEEQVQESKIHLQRILANRDSNVPHDSFGNIPLPTNPDTLLDLEGSAPSFVDFTEPSTEEGFTIPGGDENIPFDGSEYQSPPTEPPSPGRHAWPPNHPDWEQQDPDWLDKFFPGRFRFNVGIVGAGMTGLYTAMILDDIDPTIKYEILEASGRPGGRIYTHYFSPEPGDYYDVGAMRFPHIPIMSRTFDLFKRLKITKDTSRDPAQGTLIPYYLSGPKNPKLYNNIRVWGASKPFEKQDYPDTFRVSVSNGGTVPDRFVSLGSDQIMSDLFAPWKELFIADFKEAWRKLKEMDSTAVTLRLKLIEHLKSLPTPLPEPLPFPLSTPRELYYTSNWCETMGGSTGTFETSFITNLIHSLEFDWPARPDFQGDPLEKILKGKENVWWCVNGGVDIVTRKMLEKVKRKPLYNHKVTKMRLKRAIPQPTMKVHAHVSGTVHEKSYTHVINTTSLGCAQTMDLGSARNAEDPTSEENTALLDYAQREAIRVLGYARAVKMGIKFSRRWWATDKGIVQGGQGKTDRPTRVVVYPSYALDTPEDKPGVLLACYNTAQDAGRLGALLQGSDGTRQELLYNCIIADLAEMHEIDESVLRSLTISYHVHNWGSDPLTRGSWGEFGPGQYSSFFGRIQRPAAEGHLFFGSESTSIYPGWIVGSLNSAYRCVRQMILSQICKTAVNTPEDLLRLFYLLNLLLKLRKRWGPNKYEPRTEQEGITDVKGVEGWQVYLGILGAKYGL